MKRSVRQAANEMPRPKTSRVEQQTAKRSPRPTAGEATERAALRRRVQRMCDSINQSHWNRCFSLIDPHLRDAGKVALPLYSQGLAAFQTEFGPIKPWYVRLSLHLDAAANKRDSRPFAYVYIVWQDRAGEFHMFRQRWVRDAGRWFSRVVGLVPNVAGADDGLPTRQPR